MKSTLPVRYKVFASLAVLALAACSQQAAPPSPTPPPPPAIAVPAPTPAPAIRPSYDDWRDAPATDGGWRSIKAAGAPASALFEAPSGDPLVEIRCSNDRRIEIRRAGTGSQELPMTFRTVQADGSFGADTRTARPVRPLMYQASVPAVDPMLDRVAFSRGRFTLEVPGLPTLYLPSEAEMTRVFQECRAR